MAIKKKSFKYIIDVVPLTRIPLSRNQSFSYMHEEKLPAGTLVSVPLFSRKLEGIVVGSRDDFHRLGNIELKKIDKIIEKEFLTKSQLELARFISDYYISPLGIVLKGFVPKRTKSRKYKVESIKYVKKEIKLTNEQKKAVAEVFNSKFPPKADRPLADKIPASPAGGQNSKFLLYGPSGSGKTEIYIHSILELRKKDPSLQFLVLLPELTLAPQAIERYGQYFSGEEIVVVNSNITAGQFYTNWLRIKSGEAKIILASRKGAFSPFKKLGLVVVDEEQDMSYKNWDMNPRYDARKVAEKLGELHNCPVVRGSATPAIETYFRAIKKDLQLIELPVLNLEEERRNPPDGEAGKKEENKDKKFLTSYFLLSISFNVVDMRKERLNRNISCISKKLKSEITYALKNNLQTILFINRQGMSNFSVCENCKTVLKCPKCERALIYDKEGAYRCIHCSYKTSIIPHCQKCKGIIFKNVGLGTQKVEREIQNIFPSAKIARVDSQTIKKTGFQDQIYRNFSQGKIDILVGTQMITKGWDFPNLALVGIIDADNMLSIPDFSTGEKAFQAIMQAFGRTARPGAKFPGVAVIQTYQPENKFWKWISEKNWKAFYEYETAERKALALPPFGKITRLVFQDYSRKKVEKEAKRVYDLIKPTKNIKASEPQESYIANVRGRHRMQIILKYKEKMPQEAAKILRQLPSGWIVDIDPISIL